jgi:hypothetical protein
MLESRRQAICILSTARAVMATTEETAADATAPGRQQSATTAPTLLTAVAGYELTYNVSYTKPTTDRASAP